MGEQLDTLKPILKIYFVMQGGMGPDTTRINVSHVIHHVAFGDSFPGQANPLDGFHRIVDVDSGTFKYFLKLVPTTYISPRGSHHPLPGCRVWDQTLAPIIVDIQGGTWSPS